MSLKTTQSHQIKCKYNKIEIVFIFVFNATLNSEIYIFTVQHKTKVRNNYVNEK